MAIRKVKQFKMTIKFTNLGNAYRKRFKRPIPANVMKSMAFGSLSPREVESTLETALQQGRPDSEWEQILQSSSEDPPSVTAMVDWAALQAIEQEPAE